MAGAIAGLAGSTSGDAVSSAVRDMGEELGRDQFLELLVTELKYQDALEPVKDKDFIAQLAQFSSLEQINNLSDSFAEFTSTSRRNDALALLGAHITATEAESGEALEGDAVSVRFAEDEPEITIRLEDGSLRIVDMSEVGTASVEDAA